jgi:hypothetical protein
MNVVLRLAEAAVLHATAFLLRFFALRANGYHLRFSCAATAAFAQS